MPRKLRQGKRRRELTITQRELLLTGTDWPRNSFADEDEMRQAWQNYRRELLAFWLQDPEEWEAAGNREDFGNPAPGGPGTRPWAWWRYESPGQRRHIGGCKPDSEAEIDFGAPGPSMYDDLDNPPVFESQSAFLRRLRRLERGELKRLTRADFAPETLTTDENGDYLHETGN